jgi:hypothetical protein
MPRTMATSSLGIMTMIIVFCSAPKISMAHLRPPIHLLGCLRRWARAVSGHAAALPSPAMNSRRRIRDLPRSIGGAYRGPRRNPLRPLQRADRQIRRQSRYSRDIVETDAPSRKSLWVHHDRGRIFLLTEDPPPGRRGAS